VHGIGPSRPLLGLPLLRLEVAVEEVRRLDFAAGLSSNGDPELINDTKTLRTPGKDGERGNEGDDGRGSRAPRLSRSSSDRVVAGVAGGLGHYFDVDPVMFRIGFAVSVLFGGVGILAYAMLALLVPTDGEPDRAQRLGHRLQAAMSG
jgi:phage shock protein PspC (stress-responsive transcriptional regulator)